MDLEKRFIEVAATDTVKQVIEKLDVYREANGTDAIWLIVSLVPHWQFATVEVSKLYEVDSADWDQPLEETTIGRRWERSDVVPKALLEEDHDRALRMAHNNRNEVLIVQDTVGLFMEQTLPPPCYTQCPYCSRRQRVASNNLSVWCGNCEGKYRAKCDDVGGPL